MADYILPYVSQLILLAPAAAYWLISATYAISHWWWFFWYGQIRQTDNIRILHLGGNIAPNLISPHMRRYFSLAHLVASIARATPFSRQYSDMLRLPLMSIFSTATSLYHAKPLALAIFFMYASNLYMHWFHYLHLSLIIILFTIRSWCAFMATAKAMQCMEEPCFDDLLFYFHYAR